MGGRFTTELSGTALAAQTGWADYHLCSCIEKQALVHSPLIERSSPVAKEHLMNCRDHFRMVSAAIPVLALMLGGCAGDSKTVASADRPANADGAEAAATIQCLSMHYHDDGTKSQCVKETGHTGTHQCRKGHSY